MTSGDKLRVLVVEDEAIVLMLLEDMLQDLGHEVAAAAVRLSEASAMAANLEIDLAIVDVNLHGEETYSLVEVLAERGVPFLFSTGYGPAGLKEKWRSSPVLQKPFQIADLEAAIARALK